MSENGKFGKDEAYFILQDIKTDLRRLDSKISDSLERSAARDEKMESLAEQVEYLTHVVIEGNGKPSLMHQLSDLRRDITENKIKLDNVEREIKKEETPHDIKMEKVKLAAKVIALMTVIAAEAASLFSIVKNLLA